MMRTPEILSNGFYGLRSTLYDSLEYLFSCEWVRSTMEFFRDSIYHHPYYTLAATTLVILPWLFLGSTPYLTTVTHYPATILGQLLRITTTLEDYYRPLVRSLVGRTTYYYTLTTPIFVTTATLRPSWLIPSWNSSHISGGWIETITSYLGYFAKSPLCQWIFLLMFFGGVVNLFYKLKSYLISTEELSFFTRTYNYFSSSLLQSEPSTGRERFTYLWYDLPGKNTQEVFNLQQSYYQDPGILPTLSSRDPRKTVGRKLAMNNIFLMRLQPTLPVLLTTLTVGGYRIYSDYRLQYDLVTIANNLQHGHSELTAMGKSFLDATPGKMLETPIGKYLRDSYLDCLNAYLGYFSDFLGSLTPKNTAATDKLVELKTNLKSLIALKEKGVSSELVSAIGNLSPNLGSQSILNHSYEINPSTSLTPLKCYDTFSHNGLDIYPLATYVGLTGTVSSVGNYFHRMNHVLAQKVLWTRESLRTIQYLPITYGNVYNFIDMGVHKFWVLGNSWMFGFYSVLLFFWIYYIFTLFLSGLSVIFKAFWRSEEWDRAESFAIVFTPNKPTNAYGRVNEPLVFDSWKDVAMGDGGKNQDALLGISLWRSVNPLYWIMMPRTQNAMTALGLQVIFYNLWLELAHGYPYQPTLKIRELLLKKL